MKKILLMPAFLLISANLLHAQNEATLSKKELHADIKRNIVKVNILAFALKNISVEYERQITKKTTLAFTARVMPETGLPFLSTFQDAITDPITKLQVPNFRTSNYALMPQVRFYLSHKGAFHGFYIAPFVSYARYSGNLPYVYADSNQAKTIFLSGDLHAITGGIMFGAQWKIAKRLYLDWWIAGPHYGFSKGQVNSRQPLSPTEQSNLQAELNSIDIPILKTTSTVDANGATVDFKGPWLGIRGGLCIGFRF